MPLRFAAEYARVMVTQAGRRHCHTIKIGVTVDTMLEALAVATMPT